MHLVVRRMLRIFQRYSYLGRCLTLIFLLCLFSWLSLFSWSIIPISGQQAFSALLNPDRNIIAHSIVLDLRLPRVFIGSVVGACFAVAGAIMQGLTRNPLASPSVLGVNAGAALGMATLTVLAPSFSLFGTSVAAILGGAITWSLVMFLGSAWRGGNEYGRLVLAGVAISALCASLTKAIIILHEDQAIAVLTWLAGSLGNARWGDWQQFWPMALFGLVGAQLMTPTLNLLNLGEDSARNLGVELGWARMICSLLVLVLAGAALSVAGSIAFIGLLVPHIARLFVGQDYRKILPVAAILGALLVVMADLVSRMIIFPLETPVGAILALIGAPFFIYMVSRRKI